MRYGKASIFQQRRKRFKETIRRQENSYYLSTRVVMLSYLSDSQKRDRKITVDLMGVIDIFLSNSDSGIGALLQGNVRGKIVVEESQHWSKKMMPFVDVNSTEINESGEIAFRIPYTISINKNFQRDAKVGKIIPLYADRYRGVGQLYIILDKYCMVKMISEVEKITQEELDSLEKMNEAYLES